MMKALQDKLIIWVTYFFFSVQLNAMPTEPNTEEVENKLKMDWIDFQEDEKKFLEDLGLLIIPDEPLPDV